VSIRLGSKAVRVSLVGMKLILVMLSLSIAPYSMAKNDWMANAKKSIVTIKYKQDRFNGVITSADGVVFSVSHGFDNDKVRALSASLYNGKTVKLDLLFNDPYADVAIFKIRSARKSFHFIKPAAKALIADKVTVLGKLSSRQRYSVIQGAVLFNQLNLPDFVGGQKKFLPKNFSFEKGIFHSAKTKPGLSGSALLSENGQLVGINSLMLGSRDDSSKGGFTIGIDLYLNKIKQRTSETLALKGLEDKLDFLLEGLESYGSYMLKDQATAESLVIKLRKQSLDLATRKGYSESKALQWVWTSYIEEVDALKKQNNDAA